LILTAKLLLISLENILRAGAVMLDIYTLLGWINVFSVMIPGIVLLVFIPWIKISSVRNLTIILSFFAILHGIYHLSYIVGFSYYGPFIDLATALMLIGLGLYYSQRIFAAALFAFTVPDTAAVMVPIALVVALIVFIGLAIKSKSIRSLQAQLSIFIIIWTIAELLRSLLLINVINASISLQLLGLEIHTAAMVTFGVFLLTRFYQTATSVKNSKKDTEWLTKEQGGSPQGAIPR
jgi:hypothetical protein